MSETIKVRIDKQGNIVIPAEIRERLGWTPGMTLVAEQDGQGQLHLRVQRALPQVIEEEGVLVVTSPVGPELDGPEHLSQGLADAVHHDRERRVASLWPGAKRRRLTVRDLRESGLIGLWKDRTDIEDSSDYARQLREQAQKRGDIS